MFQSLSSRQSYHVYRVLFGAILVLNTHAGVLAQTDATSNSTKSEAELRLKSDIQTFASDEMEGRGVGTKGLDVAADLIAARWKELGLNTDIFDGSPFQEFSLDGPIVVGTREKNRLVFSGAAEQKIELEMEKDFTPVSLGNSRVFDAPLVFVGYGITAFDETQNLNYDDYAGLDVAGKAVIVLRKEPRQNDEKSPFSGTDPSQHAFFSAKLANAIQHKAAAMIIVNDQETAKAGDGDTLPSVEGAGRSFTTEQIPTIWVKREALDKVLAQSLSKSLADLESEIDSDLSPRSTEIANWRAAGEANIQPSKIKLKNVVATLPGEGDLAEQFVVIGAHYDHVGMGGQGSLAPQTIAVHNGADDNASGTVSLLEVARTLKNTLSGKRRTIIFIAFSAEERGLIGSRYYVRNPRFALENTVAMLNMDMVGRFTGDVLTVYGTGTGKELDSLLDEAIESVPLGLEKIPFGYGPSDHQSFFEMKIPVLHFFTGLHNDYHRPSDDADKINVEGMATISSFVAKLATKIATDPQRVSFVEVKGRAVPARQPPGKLGVEIEDNPTGEVGVIVRKTEPGKAAMNAGIIAGDMIVRMNNREVDSPRILTEILRNTLPGEIMEVEVVRDQQSKKFAVKLQR